MESKKKVSTKHTVYSPSICDNLFDKYYTLDELEIIFRCFRILWMKAELSMLFSPNCQQLLYSCWLCVCVCVFSNVTRQCNRLCNRRFHSFCHSFTFVLALFSSHFNTQFAMNKWNSHKYGGDFNFTIFSSWRFWRAHIN